MADEKTILSYKGRPLMRPPITDYIPLTMQALSCKVFNDYNACEFDL